MLLKQELVQGFSRNRQFSALSSLLMSDPGMRLYEKSVKIKTKVRIVNTFNNIESWIHVDDSIRPWTSFYQQWLISQICVFFFSVRLFAAHRKCQFSFIKRASDIKSKSFDRLYVTAIAYTLAKRKAFLSNLDDATEPINWTYPLDFFSKV